MSDQAQLESELNYSPPQNDKRFFKTHPPGYNVMSGLGAFFGLIGFLLGLLGTVSMLGGGGISEVLGCIVGLVVAMVFGWKLPRVIWQGIGAGARAPLRALGRLGAAAVLIPCFLMTALLVVTLKGVFSGPTYSEDTRNPNSPPTVAEVGPLRGPDWQVLVNADNEPLTLSLEQAHARCEALGEGWRLPKLSDQGFVIKNVTNPAWKNCIFHFDNVGDYHGYFYFGESVNQWCPRADDEDLPRQVLCIKSP